MKKLGMVLMAALIFVVFYVSILGVLSTSLSVTLQQIPGF